LYLLAKELGLKYLIKEGNSFTGPAVGLAIVIDKITRNLSIQNMLDLCCGTGALAKIALLNGVKKVTCLDLNLKVAKENLREFEGKVEFVESNIFKFKPKKFYDLIVLDAPRDLLERLLKEFIPHLKRCCDIFVMWHGNSEEIDLNAWVREKLRKNFLKLMEIACYGEEMSCCSSTQKGKEWIDKLFKIW
ncbi:MAG TPA: methyltransferase domain-containing protein, partial [Candidatus Aenigmarchaeota archaeon]|nr:methyltransferase domain-containing protein [Candidatus Aenigmarchaeota archaeon]